MTCARRVVDPIRHRDAEAQWPLRTYLIEPMEQLAFERRHANGVVARVFRELDGAGYRADALPAAAFVPDREWPYLDTIDDAQAEADALAHPGCRGEGCGRCEVAKRSPSMLRE